MKEKNNQRTIPVDTQVELPVIEEPYTVLPDASKASFFYLRLQVNAYLNSRGGTIAIGFNHQLDPVGVKKTAPARDELRCQVDALLNASEPQVDADCVSVKFIEIRPNYYVIYIYIKPGSEAVYFTCDSKAQAYTNSLDEVRLLSQNEVLRRYTISRAEALELEESNREVIIQEQVVQDAVLFSQNKDSNTRVICLEGPKHSGKTWLIQNIKQQLQYNHCLEINFKKFVFLDDAYLELIRELDPGFSINYAMRHIAIKPIRKLERLDDLFSADIEDQEECQVLENIYMNMFDFEERYLLIIENLEISADRFIPKGKQLIVLITGNQQINCEEGPACHVVHLETREFNSNEIRCLVETKLKLKISEELAERLLSTFDYDTSAILSKLEAYSDDLPSLEKQLSLASFSSLRIFEQTANGEEHGILKPLCIVPDKFNLPMAAFFISNLNLLFEVGEYLTAKNGYYRIDQEVRAYILGVMSDEETEMLDCKLIDYYINEVYLINERYREQRAGGTASNIAIKVFGKSLQDWVNHNLINLEHVIRSSIVLNHRSEEFYRELTFVVNKRVNSTIISALNEMGSVCNIVEK